MRTRRVFDEWEENGEESPQFPIYPIQGRKIHEASPSLQASQSPMGLMEKSFIAFGIICAMGVTGYGIYHSLKKPNAVSTPLAITAPSTVTDGSTTLGTMVTTQH